MSSKSRFRPKSRMQCRFCKKWWHANTMARVEAYVIKHTIEDCTAADNVVRNAVEARQKAQPVEPGPHAMAPPKVITEAQREALMRGEVLPSELVPDAKEPSSSGLN